MSISLYGPGSPGVNTQPELQGLQSACEVSRWTQQHLLAFVGKSFISCLFNLKNRENTTFPTRLTGSQKPEWKRKGAMKILLHEVLERIQHWNNQAQHHRFPDVTRVMRAASVSLSYGICKLGIVVPTSVGVVTIRWGMQQARTELGTFWLQLFFQTTKGRTNKS